MGFASKILGDHMGYTKLRASCKCDAKKHARKRKNNLIRIHHVSVLKRASPTHLGKYGVRWTYNKAKRKRMGD